jgi:hypothetical protein
MNEQEENKIFSHNEEQERKALDGLFNEILKETDKVSYDWTHTPPSAKVHYDSLVKQHDKLTNKILTRMFFEAKIRGVDYDTLLIEKYKLTELKKFVKDKNDKIYYANFLPSNTVVFDLLKIEKNLVFIEEEHNIKTADKELGKRKKWVAYPPISDGTVFPFIYTPEEYTETVIVDENFEAFPKEDPIKLDVAAEIKKIINGDHNGEVTFSSYNEFRSLPHHIQWRYVAENFLRLFLLPTENKQEMIAKYGSVEKLYKFVKERERQRYLAKFGILSEENQYEIK